MKNLNVKVITEIAIFAAIGFVLDFIQGLYSDFLPTFFNGGSVGIAMVAVFVIAYRRGFIPALLCGSIMGLLDMIDAVPYANTWYEILLQYFLDYILAYGICSLAAIFYLLIRKDKGYLFVILGCIIGGLGKLLCHTISGCLYFDSPVWASFTYNASYIIPSIILCCIVMAVVFIKNKKLFIIE